MAGIIGTGTEYQNRAMSGFIRQSAQDEEINRANMEIKAKKDAAVKSNTATGAVAGGMAGYAYGAEMGAALGTEITPGVGTVIGGVAGAALGFLFSRMM